MAIYMGKGRDKAIYVAGSTLLLEILCEERIGEVWRSEESRKVGKVPALILLCVEISLSSHGSATSFQQIPDAS